MTSVTRDKEVGLRGGRAVQELCVSRIGRGNWRNLWKKHLAVCPKRREQSRYLIRREREFRPGEHAGVSLNDILGKTWAHQTLVKSKYD